MTVRLNRAKISGPATNTRVKLIKSTGGVGGAVNLSNAIAAYYKFDGDFTDSVGGHDGTGTLIDFVSGKTNQGIRSNTVNTSVVSLQNPVNLGTSWTVNVWMKDPGGTYADFLLTANDDLTSWSNSIKVNPDRSFGMWFGPGEYATAFVELVNNSTFEMLTLSYDGTTFKIYVDGVSQTVTLLGWSSSSVVPPFSPNHIGHNCFGVVDEMGLWSRVLTSAEVTALYNGGNGLTYEQTIASISRDRPRLLLKT